MLCGDGFMAPKVRLLLLVLWILPAPAQLDPANGNDGGW